APSGDGPVPGGPGPRARLVGDRRSASEGLMDVRRQLSFAVPATEVRRARGGRRRPCLAVTTCSGGVSFVRRSLSTRAAVRFCPREAYNLRSPCSGARHRTVIGFLLAWPGRLERVSRGESGCSGTCCATAVVRYVAA